MEKYTIKDIENLSGIKAHTLRIWEQRYSIIKPERTDTNIRYYSAGQLKKILNVSLLNKYGYKISHIDKMTDGDIEQKLMSLAIPDARLENFVNSLIKQMIDMDINQFEQSLEDAFKNMGVERVITQVVYPFLEKTGMLWLTNNINPAQEHLTSNVIRQKLIAAIDSCTPALLKDKTALLFLPDAEYHEISLLFVWYMLKKRGVKVMYLGASISLKDVLFTDKIFKPDLIYTHLTNTNSRTPISTIIDTILGSKTNAKLVISGRSAADYKRKAPEKVLLNTSLEAVLSFVKEL